MESKVFIKSIIIVKMNHLYLGLIFLVVFIKI